MKNGLCNSQKAVGFRSSRSSTFSKSSTKKTSMHSYKKHWSVSNKEFESIEINFNASNRFLFAENHQIPVWLVRLPFPPNLRPSASLLYHLVKLPIIYAMNSNDFAKGSNWLLILTIINRAELEISVLLRPPVLDPPNLWWLNWSIEHPHPRRQPLALPLFKLVQVRPRVSTQTWWPKRARLMRTDQFSLLNRWLWSVKKCAR